MKYFTSEWRNGDMSDLEVERVRANYRHLQARIAPLLPFNAQELSTAVNLHDGLVVQFALSRKKSEFVIRLICGDLQTGYYDMTLRYIGALTKTMDTAALRAIAADRNSQLLYDEIDIDGNGFIHHNMSFYPKGEIEVVFKDVSITKRAQMDRGVPKVDATYVEEPVSEQDAISQ